MPRINLLPWREQQRTERKKAFGVGMFGAFIAAFAVAAVAWFMVSQMMDSQRDRNNELRAEIQVLDKQIEEINDLEQQKQQHIARMQIIESLQRSRPEIVHVFDTFARIIPDGVYLTALQQTNRRIRVQGVTQSASRVAGFLRAIEASEWLTFDGLEGVNRSGQSNNFTLYAQQVDPQAAPQSQDKP